MDPYAPYAERAQQVLAESGKNRVLITIAGVPGSGKSSVAEGVARLLNDKNPGSAVSVGMDGFHLTRKQLDAMEDPVKAHKYRGAPFTFDSDGVVDLARRLKDNSAVVEAPTFDHALKDPVEGGVTVDPKTKIVLLEGLYLQLQQPPWDKINEIADDTWFVAVDEAVARERLAQRHVASGITKTLEEGYSRAEFNDIPNGRDLVANSRPANVQVKIPNRVP